MDQQILLPICALGVVCAIITMIIVLESSQDDDDVDDYDNSLVLNTVMIHECAMRGVLARKERIGRHRHERRSCWAYPRTQLFLERALMTTYSDRMFKSRLRISRSTYNVLVARLGPHLQRQDTNFRKAVTVHKRVAVALHRFASGANLQLIADLYGISVAAAQKIVIEFCDAIHKSGLHDLYIKWPSSMRMRSLSQEFQALQGIPNVIGAIDGSHIPIIAPRRHHEDYFNRKGFHSIILQMGVTAKCLVWDYHIGWAGSMHDWNVFQRTYLGQQCENMRLGDFCLLGDCAYPARFWMLPPFKGSKEGLTQEHSHWNYIQPSSRMPVERAFGMLKSRFRILLKRCDMLLTNVPRMVATCLVLHNMCIIHGDKFDDAWVQEARAELERVEREAIAMKDKDLQNSTQNGLHEITATALIDVVQMENRAQADTPLEDASIPDGKTRRDNLAKVMFQEHQKKALHTAFGLDSADECYDSSSDDGS